jgi:hypothetical protein
VNLRRLSACALIAVLLPLAACGNGGLKWTEDVLLPDGRTVTLTRYQEFKGPSVPFQPPTESYYWFEFKNPDTGKKVRWENDRYLATVALSLNGAIPQLLTSPNFSGAFKFNCPDPPYLLFRYVEGRWVQVPLLEIVPIVITSNMTSFNVRYVRQFIEANHGHLSAANVAAHGLSSFQGKVIDLRALKEQTFGEECDDPNYMLRRPGEQQ